MDKLKQNNYEPQMKRKIYVGPYDFDGRRKKAWLMHENGEIDSELYENTLGEIYSDEVDFDLHGPLDVCPEHY